MSLVRFLFLALSFTVAFSSFASERNVTVSIQDRRSFFKKDNEVNHDFVAKFATEFTQRRQELLGLYVNIEVNKGSTKEEALKSAADEDQIIAIDLLLKYLGQLDHAPMEKAQWIAQKILDLNFAIESYGKPPMILQVPKIANGVIHQWTLDLKTSIEREANNLWDVQNNKYYSVNDLKALQKSGVDLSTLNPGPSSGIWRNPGKISAINVKDFYFSGKDSLHNGMNIVYPKENVGVFNRVKTTQTSPKINITYVGTDGKSYRAKLKFGKDMHAQPTASALFATLGFPAEIVRYYRDFKLYFKKGTNLTQLKQDWSTYYKGIPPILLPNKAEDFIKEVGKDANGDYVVFTECMMDLQPEGLLRAGYLDFNRNGIDHWRDSRAYALLNLWIENNDWAPDNSKLILRETSNDDYDFHYVVHDVGCSFGGLLCEKLDKYRFHPISDISKKQITFDFRSPRNQPTRDQATLADYRWGARLMAQLTRQQFVDAVNVGQWPDSMEQILVEKLISRRNDFVKAFGLLGEKLDDGTVISEIPVNEKITTDDGAVVKGEIKKSKYEGYDTNFGEYWSTLLWRPALKALKDMGKMGVRMGLCQIEKIGVEPVWVGVSKGLVAEAIISICRDVVKNPKPTSEEDIWLVRDTMRYGIRGGAGYVLAADVGLVKKYTLVYGARTQPEGLNARHKFLDVLLPFSIKKSQLPKRFVLIREDSIIPRVRLRSDDAWYTGVGIEAFDGEHLMSRNVVADRGDDTLVFYQDKSHHNEAAVKLFIDLQLIKIPFLKANTFLEGKNHGTVWTLKPSESGPESPETIRILTEVVRNGDFSEIHKVPHIKQMKLEGKILHYTSWALNLLGFMQTSKTERQEEVVVAPVDSDETLQVYRDEYLREKGYSFLGIREFDHIKLRGFLSQKSGSSVPDPLVMMQIILHDTNTKSEELDNGYIKFLNGFFPASQLKFTAEIHNSNNNWGSIQVNLNATYYQEGIDALLAANDSHFVKNYVHLQNYDNEKINRAWNEWYNPDSDRKNYGGDDGTQLTYLPSYLEKGLGRLSDYIKNIRLARVEHGEKQLAYIVRAIRSAIYDDKNGHSLDPSLFGAINSWMGEQSVYIARNIVSPFDEENRFPGGKGLQWETIGHDRNSKIVNMVILPEDVLEIWTMFDWLKGQK